ncbi:hypothetical protein HJ01_03540 [Flavobacterium frigoris PS1]|uniref:Uncharacterized protein n=1 Tax=Flavobacterium frigoris (strain PS1) TaxID=1086011 RepID=H7FWJ3_FLAFP|nr:hypothetical protein HJ01_03540 [Flavobacterium frigoris PS1]
MGRVEYATNGWDVIIFNIHFFDYKLLKPDKYHVNYLIFIVNSNLNREEVLNDTISKFNFNYNKKNHSKKE